MEAFWRVRLTLGLVTTQSGRVSLASQRERLDRLDRVRSRRQHFVAAFATARSGRSKSTRRGTTSTGLSQTLSTSIMVRMNYMQAIYFRIISNIQDCFQPGLQLRVGTQDRTATPTSPTDRKHFTLVNSTEPLAKLDLDWLVLFAPRRRSFQTRSVPSVATWRSSAGSISDSTRASWSRFCRTGRARYRVRSSATPRTPVLLLQYSLDRTQLVTNLLVT